MLPVPAGFPPVQGIPPASFGSIDYNPVSGASLFGLGRPNITVEQSIAAYGTSYLGANKELVARQEMVLQGIFEDTGVDPAQWTPEEAQAQTDAALAKIATVNPDLAQQLVQDRQTAATEGSSPGHGVLGFLGSLPRDIFSGIGEVLKFLGRTAHIVPQLMYDDPGQDTVWSDLGTALSGKSTVGWGEVLDQWGWDDSGDFGWAQHLVAFAGDVATDPLTYVGTGALSKGATAARVGSEALAKDVAAKAFLRAGVDAEKALELGSSVAEKAIANPGLEKAVVWQADDIIVDGIESQVLLTARKEAMADAAELHNLAYLHQRAGTLNRALSTEVELADGTVQRGIQLSSGRVYGEAEAIAAIKSARDQLPNMSFVGLGGFKESKAAYEAVKSLEGFLGGVRLRGSISTPFFGYRWVSPSLGELTGHLPGTTALRGLGELNPFQQFTKLRRFFTGQSVVTRATNYLSRFEGPLVADRASLQAAIDSGMETGAVGTWQDVWDALSATMNKGDEGKVSFLQYMDKHAPEFADVLRAGPMGTANAFVTASDMAGRLTAHFRSGVVSRLGWLGQVVHDQARMIDETRRNFMDGWYRFNYEGTSYTPNHFAQEFKRVTKDFTDEQHRHLFNFADSVPNMAAFRDPEGYVAGLVENGHLPAEEAADRVAKYRAASEGITEEQAAFAQGPYRAVMENGRAALSQQYGVVLPDHRTNSESVRIADRVTAARVMPGGQGGWHYIPQDPESAGLVGDHGFMAGRVESPTGFGIGVTLEKGTDNLGSPWGAAHETRVNVTNDDLLTLDYRPGVQATDTRSAADLDLYEKLRSSMEDLNLRYRASTGLTGISDTDVEQYITQSLQAQGKKGLRIIEEDGTEHLVVFDAKNILRVDDDLPVTLAEHRGYAPLHLHERFKSYLGKRGVSTDIINPSIPLNHDLRRKLAHATLDESEELIRSRIRQVLLSQGKNADELDNIPVWNTNLLEASNEYAFRGSQMAASTIAHRADESLAALGHVSPHAGLGQQAMRPEVRWKFDPDATARKLGKLDEKALAVASNAESLAAKVADLEHAAAVRIAERDGELWRALAGFDGAPAKFPKYNRADKVGEGVQYVEIDVLDYVKEFDRAGSGGLRDSLVTIEQLKVSIEHAGLDDSLILGWDPETGALKLIEGNHRLAALKQLGYTHAPVRISRYRDLDNGVSVSDLGIELNDLREAGPGSYAPGNPLPSELGLPFDELSAAARTPGRTAGITNLTSRVRNLTRKAAVASAKAKTLLEPTERKRQKLAEELGRNGEAMAAASELGMGPAQFDRLATEGRLWWDTKKGKLLVQEGKRPSGAGIRKLRPTHVVSVEHDAILAQQEFLVAQTVAGRRGSKRLPPDHPANMTSEEWIRSQRAGERDDWANELANTKNTPEQNAAIKAERKRALSAANDQDYYYHVTPNKNLDDITRDGLKPTKPVDDKDVTAVYFGGTGEEALNLTPMKGARGGAILRVRRSGVAVDDYAQWTGQGEVRTRAAVKADQLEVLQKDGTWKPLVTPSQATKEVHRMHVIEALLDDYKVPGETMKSHRGLNDELDRAITDTADQAVKVFKNASAEDRKMLQRLQGLRVRAKMVEDERNRLVAQRKLVASKSVPMIADAQAVAGKEGWVRMDFIEGHEDWFMPAFIAEEFKHALGRSGGLNGMQKMWREFVMGPWKRWATVYWPAFHARNMLGGYFNNWLGGVGNGNYDDFLRYVMPASREGSAARDVLVSPEMWTQYNFARDFGKNMEGSLTWGHVSDRMAELGIFRSNIFDDALLRDLDGAMAGVINHGRRGLDRVRHIFKQTGGTTESLLRGAAWLHGMEEAGGDALGARAFTMVRHGDYEDLTDWEFGFVRDIMPFYKWTRTNYPLQIHQLFESPGKLLTVAKAEKQLFEAVTGGDEEDWQESQANMPEWMRESFTIPLGKKDGDKQKYLFADLPMADLYMGVNDLFGKLLPVGRPLFESYVLNKSLATEKPLVGKMERMADWVKPFGPLLHGMGLANKGADGAYYVSDKTQNWLNMAPLVSRFRDYLFEDPDKVQQRGGLFLQGVLTGFSGRVVGDNTEVQAEQEFFYDHVQPVIDQWKTMGITLPSKDEIGAEVYVYLGLTPPE